MRKVIETVSYTCDECGTYIGSSISNAICIGEKHFCMSCYSSKFTECSWCGKFFKNSEIKEDEHSYDQYICEDCAKHKAGYYLNLYSE